MCFDCAGNDLPGCVSLQVQGKIQDMNTKNDRVQRSLQACNGAWMLAQDLNRAPRSVTARSTCIVLQVQVLLPGRGVRPEPQDGGATVPRGSVCSAAQLPGGRTLQAGVATALPIE